MARFISGNRPLSSDERIIILHPHDNVAVLKQDMAAGAAIAAPQGKILCAQAIPRGHKLALAPIEAGAAVIKYDQIIGFAAEAIAPGAYVHDHNLTLGDFGRDFERDFGRDFPAAAPTSEGAETAQDGAETARMFQGYRRADGRAGTRNFIAVLSTVNCSASVCRAIANAFAGPAMDDYAHVDGVVACTHDFGCQSHERLERVLAGYALHANVAGFVMVGLGCENTHVRGLREKYRLPEHDMARYLVIQEEGGTRKTVERGIAMVREMLERANGCRREPIPAAELVLGLECGGSDAYSGMTANPALGRASDLLVGQGGTAVLSETPEIFGAEHLLTRRAASPEIARQLMDHLAWWQDYAAKNGAGLNNNPSQGNKKGGLSTILEKSLGAVAKGGTAPLRAVYDYAEPVRARGLCFMDSPGYDPASVTGMIAGGATMICFTTGRGSAFGSKPVPTLKIASNSRIYRHMAEDMDINAGMIMDGEADMDSLGAMIFEAVLAAASGAPTLSERGGLGDEEFSPWHVGALM